MSVRWEVLLLILACMVVTLVPRILPMIVAHRVNFPPWFLAWLQYVPVAVISALFFREVLLTGAGAGAGATWREWDDPYLLAAFPTLFIALFSRNLFLTIVGGMLLFLLLRSLL